MNRQLAHESRSARPLLAAAATVLICAAMYYIPQHWMLREPQVLPLSEFDRAVPFWPGSGAAYFAVFPFMLAAFLLVGTRARAMRFLHASLLAQAAGMTFFVLYPVRYPRELFPIPPDAGVIGVALVRLCRSMDAPVNCLPSLHVSTIVLCVAALYGSRWFRPALATGTVLAASTLTFKQHYAIDVATGLALGLLAWRSSRLLDRTTG